MYVCRYIHKHKLVSHHYERRPRIFFSDACGSGMELFKEELALLLERGVGAY